MLELGTWIAAGWQRTFVNTAVKRLILTYLFECLGARKVGFSIDPRNRPSLLAIERIGARFQGLCEPTGEAPSLLYAVTDEYWTDVKARLKNALPSHAPFFDQ